jgi:Ribosomal protein S15
MDIKAKAMEVHVKTHPKDMSTKRKLEIIRGKQKKMLKYLRRKAISAFNIRIFQSLYKAVKCLELIQRDSIFNKNSSSITNAFESSLHQPSHRHHSISFYSQHTLL